MAGGSGSVQMAVLLVAITVMLHSAQEVFGEVVESIIADNCKNYKLTKDPQKDPEHDKVDCEVFLESFKRAFVNKDPKKITPEVFNPLMDKFKLPEHKDKYVFWSGPKDLSGRLKEYFYGIGDTVFSFADIPIPWCGKKGSNEIEMDGCPDYSDPTSAVKCYWRTASRTFAQAATGEVTVLLNDKVHYDPTRVFATDELPYLNSKKVTALHVLMVITSNNRSKINNIPPKKWWDEATPQ